MMLIDSGAILGWGIFGIIVFLGLMMLYGNMKNNSRKKNAEELAKRYDFEKHPFCIEFKAKYGISYREFWNIRQQYDKKLGLFEQRSETMSMLVDVAKQEKSSQLCNYDYNLFVINENYIMVTPDTSKMRHKRHLSNPAYKLLMEDHWDEQFLKLLDTCTVQHYEEYMIPMEKVAIRYLNKRVRMKDMTRRKVFAEKNVSDLEFFSRIEQADSYQYNLHAHKLVFAKDTKLPDLYKYAEGSSLYRASEKETFDKLVSYLED